MQAVAVRLDEGATLETIERVTDRLLASPNVIPVGEEFTSRELLDTETALIQTLSKAALIEGPNPERVKAVLAQQPTLGADQAASVEAISSAESAVSVLIGPARTGNTFTLNTIRELFENTGWRVIGAAPSARAAAELESGAGIESFTMHSLLVRLRQDIEQLNGGELLVIDEAGMADTRTLQRLVTAATDVGSRVVLVGDHRQLPEVGAGGGFAYATQHADTVARLSVNRRQQQPWEQAALTALRDGTVTDAVDADIGHRRVIITPDSATLIERAVDPLEPSTSQRTRPRVGGGNQRDGRQAQHSRTQPAHRARRLAPRRVRRDDVEGRAARRHSPQLHRPPRPNSQHPERPGRNHHRSPRRRRVDPAHRHKRVRDTRPELPGCRRTTLARLRLYDAQGGTWDDAISVGLDGLYREGAHTALSRGRQANVICLTHPEAQQLEQPPDQRTTIGLLRSGQLSLDDKDQLLNTAVAGQTEQQQWILANWPHIIEANQIDTALTAGNYGPDIDQLANEIMAGTNSWALSVAAREGEPWLAAALNHTSQPEDKRISDRVLDWLEHIANYRTTHDITARNPLGPLYRCPTTPSNESGGRSSPTTATTSTSSNRSQRRGSATSNHPTTTSSTNSSNSTEPATEAQAPTSASNAERAARELSAQNWRLGNTLAQRRIDYLKIGNFIRFQPDELDSWIEDQRVQHVGHRAG